MLKCQISTEKNLMSDCCKNFPKSANILAILVARNVKIFQKTWQIFTPFLPLDENLFYQNFVEKSDIWRLIQYAKELRWTKLSLPLTFSVKFFIFVVKFGMFFQEFLKKLNLNCFNLVFLPIRYSFLCNPLFHLCQNIER